MGILRSLKNKVLIGLLAVVALTLLIESSYSIQRQRDLINTRLRAVGRGMVKSLALPALHALVTSDLTQLQPLLEALDREGEVGAVRILDLRYQCLASTQRGELGRQIRSVAIEAAYRSNRLEVIETDAKTLDFYQPISSGERRYGMVWLGLPLTRSQSEIQQHTRDSLLAALAALIAALLVSILLTRSILGPVQQLMKAAAAVAHQDYDFVVEIPNRDELGILADTFNQMTANLRTTLQGIRLHAQRLEEARAKLASRVRELEVLNNVSLLFMTNYTRIPLAEVLRRILNLLGESLGARRLSLILVEPDGRLVIKVAKGMDPSGELTENVRLDAGGSVLDHVLKTGVSLLVADISADPRFQVPGGKRYDSSSFLSVPMVLGQQVVGVINATEKVGGQEFTTDDQRYVEVLASQIGAIIDIHRMTNQLIARERIENELRIARRIQQRMLPDLKQQVGRFSFAARSVPANEVGGDYFDLIVTPGGRVTVTLGDVSGKGIPAAMVMVALFGLIRGLTFDRRRPIETMELANRSLNLRSADMGMFASLFLGEIDTEAGSLCYCGAGHPYPLWFKPGSDAVTPLEEGGLLIGLGEELPYTQEEIRLEPGSLVMVYSDGVTDVCDRSGQEFGYARLLAVAQQYRSAGAEGMLTGIFTELDRYRDGATPRDDMSILVIECRA